MKRLGVFATAWLLVALGAGFGSQGVVADDQTRPSSGAERSLSDRYREFSMREMRELAVRTCRLIPRRVLFQTFSTVDDPSDNNYIALGFAKRIDISPIPLQRAAYDGCTRGLRKAD
jgi:hypothetical protein